MTTTPQIIVVTDANVLINLMQVARLDLCARLPGYEFVVPDHVREEITDANQRMALDDAVVRSVVRIEAITDLSTVTLFTELIGHIDRGEAACLTLAIERGWCVASDEQRRFRREAERRIGAGRIMGTKDLYLLAIRAGLLTVEQADEDKAVLERHRFKMDFESFRHIVR